MEAEPAEVLPAITQYRGPVTRTPAKRYWPNRVLEALYEGHTIATAAAGAGITVRSVQLLVRRDPVFAELVDRAKYRYNKVAETVVLSAINEGNVAVAWKFLERRMPEEYGPLRAQELPPSPPGGPGRNGESEDRPDYSRLTSEERHQLYELLMKAMQ